MASYFGVLYGLFFSCLIYGVSYFSARGALRGGVIPILVILGKYAVFGLAINYGFKSFPAWTIMVGWVTGLYAGLPVLYFVNKKVAY
jgi:hypothetical protein